MATEIKQINGFQTSDGKIFEDIELAKIYQAQIDFDNELEKLVDIAKAKYSYFLDGQEIIDFIKDNKTVLKELLNKY